MKNEKTSNDPGSKSIASEMTELFIFPVLTAVAKLSTAVFITPASERPSLLGYYLAGSCMVDLAEAAYRFYIKDELGYYDEQEKPGGRFSCLEKHILYHLPKYVINKLKRN